MLPGQARGDRVGECAAGRCRAGDDGVGAEVLGALHDGVEAAAVEAHVLGPHAELEVGPARRGDEFIGGVPMKRAANTVAGRA